MMSVERLSPAEAAARKGLSRDTVYQAIRTGELRAMCISPRDSQRQQWRILPSDLEAFVAARMNTVGGAA